jgi:hypothetical protein
MREDERPVGATGLLADLAAEASRSTKAMPVVARVSYVAGLVAFVVLEFAVPGSLGGPALAVARVAALSAFVAGAVVNARCSDDFFRRVYVNSCAIALPSSAIVLYALTSFGVHVGRATVGIVIMIWFVSFVVAFAALRRA